MRQITFIMLSISTPTTAFINQIPTGTVGVYYKFMELQSEIFSPGMWWNIHPFGHYEIVDIRPQVDYIENVECGTKDGLKVVFPEIAVFNQLQDTYVLETLRKYTTGYDNFLIKEPIRQKVVELCTTMDLQDLYIDRFPEINDMLHEFLKSYQEKLSTNLIINKISVSKPSIPTNIQNNYNRIVEERTKLRAENETQNTRLKKKETERMESEAHASMERSLAQINNMKRIDNEESEARLNRIRTEAEAKHLEIRTEAEAKTIKILAEAEEARHTEAYMRLRYYETVIANTTMVYYGDKLPSYVGSPLLKREV
jgi:erlin